MATKGMQLSEEAGNDWGFKGKNYLLAIGINKYQYWKPLNNAVKDVRDFIEILKTHYQFEADQIFTLIDEEATEDKMHAVLMKLVSLVTPEDNLVIYFSGHGHYEEGLQQGYWVPVDAPKDSVRKFISNADLVSYLKAIKSHHTFLIVDSCFSGTLMTQLRSGVRSEKYPSRRIFTSGRQEVVEDGIPGQNSPFASGILNYLRRNTDRILKTTTLIEDVKDYLERQQISQSPVDGRIAALGDEGGEFVFYLKRSEDDIWKQLVQENQRQGFERYLQFFPEGKFAEEAAEYLHALEEDNAWQTARRKNQAASYSDYIQAYPNGKYTDEAFRNLEIIEENTSWADTHRLGTLSAYSRYLIKYPNGKYAAEARQRVDELEHALKETTEEAQARKKQYQEWEEQEQARSQQKKTFRKMVEEAEQLFAEKKFSEAKSRYQACISHHQNGFEPDLDFLQNRLKESTKFESFMDLYTSGQKAAGEGNFQLALHYYQKANGVHPSKKIQEIIRVTSQKAQSGKGYGSSGLSREKQQPKSGGSALKWVIGLAATGLLCILGYMAFQPGYPDGAGDDFGQNDFPAASESNMTGPSNTESGENQTETLPSAPQNHTINFAEGIQGSWVVSDVLADIADYENLFLGTHYTFYNNGVYQEDHLTLGLNNGYYSIMGNQITISALNGVIEDMKPSSWVFHGTMTDMIYGTSNITLYFEKL